MTQTLTTERLKTIAAWRAKYGAGHNVVIPAEEAEAIAMELLANREAQPVAEIRVMPVGSGRMRQAIYWFGKQDCDLPIGTKFYTAPPAPAIAIPDKVSCEGFNPKNWVEARNLGQREGWNAYRAAMLAATPPALRDGYCLMPRALTAENGAKYALSGEFKVSRTVTCNECGGDGCMDCNDRGEFEEEITVPWITIKEIYRAAVESCHAATLNHVGDANEKAQPVTLSDDTRRMEWLVSHHVAVRQPLVYGSHAMFTAQQVSDDHEEHKTDLREQIDAAMLAAAPEGGNDA